MVYSLFLFLSMLVLLGWSPVVSAKLYPRDGIPQGDCLERMCASGVCYENDKFEGLCCPKKEDLPKMGEACTECGCLSGECEEGKCGCPNGLKKDSQNRCPCSSHTEQECPTGQYCHFYEETPYRGGACRDIKDLSLSSNERDILSEAGFSNDVVISDSAMNWWSASSFCIAHGKHLVDVKDFGCYFSGTDIPITKGPYPKSHPTLGDGLCCKKAQDCHKITYLDKSGRPYTDGVPVWNWDGTVLPGAQEELDKYSDKYVALNKIGYLRGKFKAVWTNTWYSGYIAKPTWNRADYKNIMVFTIPIGFNAGWIVTWEAFHSTSDRGILHALCE